MDGSQPYTKLEFQHEPHGPLLGRGAGRDRRLDEPEEPLEGVVANRPELCEVSGWYRLARWELSVFEQGVDELAILPHAKVEVWTSHETGRANPTDHLPLGDSRTPPESLGKGRQVQVIGFVPVRVAESHHLPRVTIPARRHDHTAGHGDHRRPAGRPVVDPEVRAYAEANDPARDPESIS